MKQRILLISFIAVFLGIQLAALHPVQAGGRATGEQLPAESHRVLKKYMAKFGSMLAGLEIMRLKEKKPDWDAINLTLQEMSSNLAEMQKTDTSGVYKEYTDMLAAGLVDIKAKAQKRDKGIFDSIDELSNACFKCHAVHRPSDYLTPKKNERLSDQ